MFRFSFKYGQFYLITIFVVLVCTDVRHHVVFVWRETLVPGGTDWSDLGTTWPSLISNQGHSCDVWVCYLCTKL